MTAEAQKKRVLVTGAAGYIGKLVTRALLESSQVEEVLATDVQEQPLDLQSPKLDYRVLDIRSSRLAATLRERQVDVVVHLAAIVGEPPNMSRDEIYAIDVGGTENLLQACVDARVHKVIVTSSGAAYGYHADNAPLLDEDQPLRGNTEYAYSHHKRLVEEMLHRYRREHPELKQLIFRPGTILGESVSNLITALFEKRVILGLRESASPFVFTWDQDVVRCIHEGVLSDKTGIYNLTSDGVMTLREIAAELGKPYLPAPTSLVQTALRVLKRFKLSTYGPEQTRFLQYRPVMANDKLKHEFGYRPPLSSRQVFDLYKQSHAHSSHL